MTGKEVYVTTDYREKQLQRALLQFSHPENANLVREALKLAGREDLIGNSPDCLVRAAFGKDGHGEYRKDGKRKNTAKGKSGGSAAAGKKRGTAHRAPLPRAKSAPAKRKKR